MKQYFLSLLFLLTMALLPSSGNAQGRIVSFNFDMDNNILEVPIYVVLFHKTETAELIISHHELNLARQLFEDPFPDFEFRANKKDIINSSFRFTNSEVKNYFLENVAETLASKEIWKRKQWARFKESLNNPHLKDSTSIITARGNSPRHILEGLGLIHKAGHLMNLPSQELIIPVSYKHGSTADLSTPQAKLVHIKRQLDEYAKQETSERHYYEFSDDSTENILTIKAALLMAKSQGRWENIDLVITHSISRTQEKAWLLTENGEYEIPHSSRRILTQKIKAYNPGCKFSFL